MYMYVCVWLAGCNKADLIDNNEAVDPARCADRGFVNSSSISGGVVCYNGTPAGSLAVYICDNGFLLMGNEARVCQIEGRWNGSIPQCIPEESGNEHSPFTKLINPAM